MNASVEARWLGLIEKGQTETSAAHEWFWQKKGRVKLTWPGHNETHLKGWATRRRHPPQEVGHPVVKGRAAQFGLVTTLFLFS